jgi:hypothetical protein
MFRTKYSVSILDSKWNSLKRGLKLNVIPRCNELIYMDEQYFTVLKVIHTLNSKQEIFIIIEEMGGKLNS